MNYYETRIHNDMVFIIPKGSRWTKKSPEFYDKNYRSWHDWMAESRPEILGNMSVTEMKTRFQVSQNHMHIGSKKEAVRLCKEISDDFTKRYPDQAYNFVVDWREGGPREQGNNVMISFWLDTRYGRKKRTNKKVPRKDNRGSKKRSRRVRSAAGSVA